jgi:GTP-binding protein
MAGSGSARGDEFRALDFERVLAHDLGPVQFIDEATIFVSAGDGGGGAVAFRREAFTPLGGPSGGDGGKGADVVFVANENVNTLLEFRFRPKWQAPRGENGAGKDCNGKAGEDLVIPVPVGTQIFDADTGELIADLDERLKRVVIARGGRGGLGNMNFATPWDRAPRHAQPGEPGESRRLRLSLKLLADVGILGFPNIGKSTFISVVWRAPHDGDERALADVRKAEDPDVGEELERES